MNLQSLRENKILRALYRLPGVRSAYHFGMALFGAAVCGFPSRELTVIGVTGTKGKTTVTELVNAALETAGHKTALLSSLRIKIGEKSILNRTGNSMPGRFFIQRFLRDAKEAGCSHVVVEVTSEGVVQSRHKFVEWDVAAITNIAPEHIENHGSFENYRAAKLAFLAYAARRGAHVLVNADDERSAYFQQSLPPEEARLYSTQDLVDWPPAAFGGLPGEFNRQNAATAAAVARNIGVLEETIINAFKGFKGVQGRMEFVAREPFRVVVDYAHTPDSLEAVYTALRADMKEGQSLICVLGSCGAHRDKWKRPVMGGIAGRHCDRVIFTDEDPYDEPPGDILRDLAAGVSEEDKRSKRVEEIVDRREAIRQAVAAARPGDTVVMTGKGSEYAIHMAGGREVEWNERKVAEEVLADVRNK